MSTSHSQKLPAVDIYHLHPVKCPKCHLEYANGPATSDWKCSNGPCDAVMWRPDSHGKCELCQTELRLLGRHHCRADGALVCGKCSDGFTARFSQWPKTAMNPVRICKVCHDRYVTLSTLRKKLADRYERTFHVVNGGRSMSPQRLFVELDMAGSFMNPAAVAASTTSSNVIVVSCSEQLAVRGETSWRRQQKLLVLESAAGGGLTRITQYVAVRQAETTDALVIHISLGDVAQLQHPITFDWTFEQLLGSQLVCDSEGRHLLDQRDVDLIAELNIPVLFVLDDFDSIAHLQERQPVKDFLVKFVYPLNRAPGDGKTLLRSCDGVVVATRDVNRCTPNLDVVDKVEYWRLQRWSLDRIAAFCRAWFAVFNPGASTERAVDAASSPMLQFVVGLPAFVNRLCEIELAHVATQQLTYSPSLLFELLLDTSWKRSRRRLQSRIIETETSSLCDPCWLPRSQLNPRPEANFVVDDDGDLKFFINQTLREASRTLCAWLDEMTMLPVGHYPTTLIPVRLHSLPRWARFWRLLGIIVDIRRVDDQRWQLKFQLDLFVSWAAAWHLLRIRSRDDLPQFLSHHWGMPGVAETFVFLADYARRKNSNNELTPLPGMLLENALARQYSATWITEQSFCDVAASSFCRWLRGGGADSSDASTSSSNQARAPSAASSSSSSPSRSVAAEVWRDGTRVRPLLRAAMLLSESRLLLDAVMRELSTEQNDLRQRFVKLVAEHSVVEGFHDAREWIQNLAGLETVSISMRSLSLVEAARAGSVEGVEAALTSTSNSNDVRLALLELAARGSFQIFCTVVRNAAADAIDDLLVQPSGFVRAVLKFAVPPTMLHSFPDSLQQQQQPPNNEAVVSLDDEMQVLVKLNIVSRVEVLDAAERVKLTLGRAPCQITHVILVRNQQTVARPTLAGDSAFDCVWEAATESLKELTVSTAEPKILGRVSDGEIREFLVRFPNLESLTLYEICEFPCVRNSRVLLNSRLKQLVLCGQLGERGLDNLGAFLQQLAVPSVLSLELRGVNLNEVTVHLLLEYHVCELRIERIVDDTLTKMLEEKFKIVWL